MLIGRESEKQVMLNAVASAYSEFIAVYGRRRVGKTFLIRETFNYRFTFQHTGIADAKTKEQLLNFRSSLRQAGWTDCPEPSSWLAAFDLLAELISRSKEKKKVIFLDELPWMDFPKSNFIPALEHFWNGFASSRKDIVLIVCGSATSWIVNKVINSHGGLHNRVTQKILLKPFTLRECELFVQDKGIEMSRYQILENYMIMGGVPYYWNFLQKGVSLAQNIDRIFFSESGELADEFHSLYASLFKNPNAYIAVVTALGKKKVGMTREEIIRESKLPDNGLFSKVLEELEYCGFIRRYTVLGKKVKSAIFQLIDSYTLFYFKFIRNNTPRNERFWSASIDSAMHRAWCGYAFERVCLLHVPQIKRRLGIEGVLSNVYSWHTNSGKEAASAEKGAQVDLLIDRNDQVINLCEMKFSVSEFGIDKVYDAELRNKKAAFISGTKTRKAVHLTLVTTYGLKANEYAGSIQSEVVMDDLFN